MVAVLCAANVAAQQDVKLLVGADFETFFDNTEYCLWIEFNDETEEACFASMLQADNAKI
jgi:hypothetical protein